MAANFWLSTHGNYWLLDPITIQQARALDLKYATPEELGWIEIWTANAIHKLAKRLQLRQQVAATATIYLRRFYLKNSYCDTEPALVAAAATYVASKAEESSCHVKTLTHEAMNIFFDMFITSFPAEYTRIAEMEFYLLEDIEFHLKIFHPYKDLIHLCGRDPTAKARRERGEGGNEKILDVSDDIVQMAWWIINDTYRSTIPLRHPPFLIAVASLFFAFSLNPPPFLASLPSPDASRSQSPEADGEEDNDIVEITPPGKDGGNGIDKGRQGRRPPQTEFNFSMPLPASSSAAQSHSFMQAQNQRQNVVAHLQPPGGTGSKKGASGSGSGSGSGTTTTSVSPATTATATPNSDETNTNSGPTLVDPITFLADLNVELDIVKEIVQEIISFYELWTRLETNTRLTAAHESWMAMTGGGGAGGSNTNVNVNVNARRQKRATGSSADSADFKVVFIMKRMKENRQRDLRQSGATLRKEDTPAGGMKR